jgi:hypothetical protein
MLQEILLHLLPALIFFLISKAFPRTRRHTDYGMNIDTINRLNARGSYVVVAAMLLWLPLSTAVFGYVLQGISGINQGFMQGVAGKILPPFSAWCVVGLIFAFAWCRAPVEGFVARLMGAQTVEALNLWGELRYGYDAERVWAWWKRAGTIAGLVAIVWVSDWGIYVYPDKLVINDVNSLFHQKQYAMQSVTNLEYAGNLLTRTGNAVPHPVYVIRFNDGKDWTSNFNDFEQVSPVLVYLSERSGVPIDTVRFWN